MNLISIGTDRKIFEQDSAVQQRIIEYGKIFDQLHVVVFSTNIADLKNIKLAENIFIYPTNSKSKLLYIWDAFLIGKSLSSKIRNLNLVVSTQDPFETGVVGLALKLFCKLPLQVQLHTDFANKYFISHSILNFIRFPLGLFVLSFADSVRVVSERVAKSVHSLAHNVSVLPIYTELKAKSLALRDSKDKRETVGFLTVARLEKEKGLKTAILAFKKVLEILDVEDPEQSRRTTFTIVGDGSERKALEALVDSLKVGEKVKFIGWQNSLEKFYNEADIYVSTSLYEGYGMSIVEAASFGLALVISDTGVADGLFKNGDAAIVCKQKDVTGFADAMFKLASDRSLRSRLGERAKSVADNHQTNLADYLNKYKQSVIDASQFFNSGHGIFKKNILLRYLVAGIMGASTQIGLLYVFTDILHFWYLYSSVFSFLAAIIVSFLLQKFWTFADNKTEQMQNQFFKYLGVAILGLLINTLSMFVLVDLLGLWYILAQIITGAFIAIMNFLMYKFFIFNK